MVFILHEPNGFGAFRPDAAFLDEDEKLKAEFDRTAGTELTENYERALLQFRRQNRLKVKFATEPAQPFQQMSKLTLEAAAKEFGDVMFADPLVVSEPVKDIIERLEPDTHQFWPVDFQSKRGKAVNDKSYFALLVLQMRDAFRPEASLDEAVYLTGSSADNWHIHGQKKAFLEGVAIDAEAAKGAHLWQEQHILSNVYFMSDELRCALTENDLKLPPKVYQCRAV